MAVALLFSPAAAADMKPPISTATTSTAAEVRAIVCQLAQGLACVCYNLLLHDTTVLYIYARTSISLISFVCVRTLARSSLYMRCTRLRS